MILEVLISLVFRTVFNDIRFDKDAANLKTNPVPHGNTDFFENIQIEENKDIKDIKDIKDNQGRITRSTAEFRVSSPKGIYKHHASFADEEIDDSDDVNIQNEKFPVAVLNLNNALSSQESEESEEYKIN